MGRPRRANYRARPQSAPLGGRPRSASFADNSATAHAPLGGRSRPQSALLGGKKSRSRSSIDPMTGCPFQPDPNKRQFFHSGSKITMRIQEGEADRPPVKPFAGETVSA